MAKHNGYSFDPGQFPSEDVPTESLQVVKPSEVRPVTMEHPAIPVPVPVVEEESVPSGATAVSSLPKAAEEPEKSRKSGPERRHASSEPSNRGLVDFAWPFVTLVAILGLIVVCVLLIVRGHESDANVLAAIGIVCGLLGGLVRMALMFLTRKR